MATPTTFKKPSLGVPAEKVYGEKFGTMGGAAAGIPRKKLASLRSLPAPSLNWPRLQTPPAGSAQSFFRSAERLVLPQPAAREQRWQLGVDVAEDFALIFLGSLLAASFHTVSGALALASWTFAPSWAECFRLTVLQASLFTLLGYSERLYQSRTIESPRNERLTVGKCIFWSTFLVGVIFPGSALRLAAGACINSSLLFARREWRRDHTSNVASTRETKNVIIVGSGTTARRVAGQLARLHFEKRAVLGFVDDGAVGDGILGSVQDLAYLVKSKFIDEIIVAGAERDVALRAIVQARQCGIGVRVVPEFFSADPEELAIRTLGEVPILTLRTESVPRLRQAVKRVVDVTCSAFGLLLLSPLLAVIAAWIRWDSAGPALYKAQRVGFKGRRFACYKFRTMVADAEVKKEELRAKNERHGASFKIHDDPRITRIGRVLRRYSLDELPQMWNILRGDMSLVGPRPHPLDDFARYGLDDLGRLHAIPGLTGLWQVTARRDPSFELNVALDREYIERWSLAADFRILAKTISAVLRGSGN